MAASGMAPSAENPKFKDYKLSMVENGKKTKQK
jgi:hypothetical protein